MKHKDFEGEIGLLLLADASVTDIANNQKAIAIGSTHPIKNYVITWFLPPVTHALKGGVRTVFMLAQNMSENWGTLNHFVIYSYSAQNINTTELCASLGRFFPKLHFTVSVFRKGVDDIQSIPASNASFCTLWTTAYLLLKYNRTSRKFYLMQDFEPSFYQAGNIYGVIEQTYRFGFSAIANTEGVGNKYRQYNDDITIFTPGVDQNTFYPDKSKTSIGNPARIVFYGRPSNPRNCFLLGIRTLTAVKRKMGDAVEIISVGEEWDTRDFKVDGIVENRGLLASMEEVADLYRSSDIGLVFMITPHPSYQPFEYMASGCVTATNINESNQWLLNEHNTLLIEPLAEVAARRIHDLLQNEESWQQKRMTAMNTIQALSWENAFRVVRDRLTRKH